MRRSGSSIIDQVARRRGFAAAYGMFLMIVMFSFASFAVDWGRVQLVRTELQRAADAAARAGAGAMANGVAAVRTAAVTVAGQNNADGESVVIIAANDVEIGNWNTTSRTFVAVAAPATGNAVRVTARRTKARGNAVPLLFGAIIGATTCDASAVSTVRIIPSNIDYSTGFTTGTPMTRNGSAVLNGTVLQLTPNSNWQTGTAWYPAKVPVNAFTTTFSLQMVSPTADGCCFVIQNNNATTQGGTAGALGSQDIGNSIAIKFDIWDNAGEGVTSTGLFLNGASPANVGSVDMTSAGVILRNGHVINVTLVYDGTTLSQTVVDASTGSTFTRTYTVNIPSVIGSGTAYVGFTGATGGASAQQNIIKWAYNCTGPLSLAK